LVRIWRINGKLIEEWHLGFKKIVCISALCEIISFLCNLNVNCLFYHEILDVDVELMERSKVLGFQVVVWNSCCESTCNSMMQSTMYGHRGVLSLYKDSCMCLNSFMGGWINLERMLYLELKFYMSLLSRTYR
jgi:hypothetical protein